MRARSRLLLPAISGLVALALVVVLVLGGSNGAKPGTRAEDFDGAVLPAGTRAPGFTLRDQDGRAVSLGPQKGRVGMVVFLPAGAPSRLGANCRVCVLTAQQVRGALDELESHQPPKAGVRAIFVSGALPAGSANRLLTQASLSSRAEYLTGGAFYLGKVWRAYRVDLPSSNSSKAEAAVTVVLIDRQGLERVAFGIEQLTPEGLSHDIRLLEGT